MGLGHDLSSDATTAITGEQHNKLYTSSCRQTSCIKIAFRCLEKQGEPKWNTRADRREDSTGYRPQYRQARSIRVVA